ncbi:hypothetical protein Pla163_33800 [Planctomycetes bacterium Pla163]|uniref:DUF2891 domain-containing protein n=1 Tax=Rohdeia mirabilis TaxID=2528008 RepID=A0A518D452_9BACT|nr:hypothetical protein Pla163_33800 [Planctomycetes bacterium Pla163]
MRIATGAALLAAALQSCAWPGRAATDGKDAPASVRDRVCEDLALERRITDLVRAGIEVKEPNHAAFVTGGAPTVFDGSYDWHSCVIAHWTLLVSSRVRGDEELRGWVAARLPIDVLEYESGLLASGEARGRPTWPYDEAWFCLLLAEVERDDSSGDDSSGDDAAARLRELRRRHESRVFEALVERPFPDGPRAERVDLDGPARPGEYCGFYRSWLWAFVALAWCEPVEPALAEQLAALWSEKAAPHLDRIAALEDAHPYDFLWVPALAALGAEAAATPGAPNFRLLAAPPLPNEVVVATVHVLGVQLSRFWPVANDPARRSAYLAARDALVAREDLWAEGFDASSHWLPQYLFIGEWLAADRP